MFDNTIKNVIIIFIFLCAAIYNIKPEFIFDEKGKFKKFGLEKNNTIFPFWLVTTSLITIVYIYFKLNKENHITK